MTGGSPSEIGAARALEIARETIAEIKTDAALVVMEEKTIEREWGWVFFYTTQQYLESGDPKDLMPGNAPLAVHRADGAVRFLSTSLPPPAAIDAYERALREAAEAGE